MQQPSHQKWMHYVDGNKKLFELTIPGTHDSGTYPSDLESAKCQGMTLEQQLNAGIRFIDIRLTFGFDDDGVLWVAHGIDSFLGLSFETDIIGTCKKFLSQNPSETILMSIKNESLTEKWGDNAKFYGDLSAIINRSKTTFYLKESMPTLQEVRGKIVLFRRFPVEINMIPGTKPHDPPRPATPILANNGLNIYNHFPADEAAPFTNASIKYYVQDRYFRWSGGSNRSEKFTGWVEPALNKAAAVTEQDTCYINFTSATGRSGGILPFTSTPMDLAETVVPLFNNYLSSNPPNRFGIIPMDFPELKPYLITQLIHCNYQNPMVFPRLRNRSNGAEYLNFDGKLHHIPSPAIAANLFKKDWDWQSIPNFNFTPVPAQTGVPLLNGRLLSFSGRPELYICYNIAGSSRPVLRHILNPSTQNAYGLFGTINPVSEATKGNYELQPPISWQ
ncbi:phosphatidylinositol-specific phospholipase C [Niabella pedocola]|uniref:1-phosphatidylinositol phosphodiesterase n=1 Tax=Niabella pedocola TaxID=1752077 RepID=A0ABS8PRS2_9BACT|nr:phosphatidylinositol-specific phospholipase C [Niabella pedocola]MCD2423777.1 phosphatidylinositol-specific phospholipase C [Niabella pedocola]